MITEAIDTAELVIGGAILWAGALGGLATAAVAAAVAAVTRRRP